jgi:oxygen-dependent protoporphyrinogen oxidase
MPEPSVVIIGGGISGLATAFYLGCRGIRSVIVEKSHRLGGLIKTDKLEGCTLEAGPDSFIATKPAVAKLTEELGASGPPIIGSNDTGRRVFIGRKGRLVPMPPGMSMMVPGDWSSALRSPLFSLSTKAGFLWELSRKPQKRSEDISVGEFVQDHFGKELLRYVADPLLTGVYGGQVSQLSARSVLPRFLEYEETQGSLIRAVRRDRQQTARKGSLFLSFAGGMQTLIDAVGSHISPTTRIVYGEVSSVRRKGNKWQVHVGPECINVPHVVFACPSYVAAGLVEGSAPPLASHLHDIPYSSAILVTLVYDREKLARPLDGFGFLVPRPERRNVAAATWASTKFPSRTPPHLAAIRAFIVDEEATALMNAPEFDILDLVRVELQRWMGIGTLPRFHTLYRWPLSMPQYVVGHDGRLERIAEHLTEYPGLSLAGNAYDGVGVPDCVRRAKAIAEAIHCKPALSVDL